MKKIIIAGVIVLIIVSIACVYSGGNNKDAAPDRIKPVRIMDITSETKAVVLDYTGIVSPGDIRKMGFKSPGKIAKIHVKEGEAVEAGDVLATLDMKELLLAEESASEDLESTRNALEFSQSVYERMEGLFQQGAVSLQDLEKAKLDLDLQRANYNRASVNSKNVQSNIEDTVLIADTDAYITDILFKEGEMAGAGYPVIIIRSGDLTVNTGLSEEDAAKVRPGAPVYAKDGNREIPGKVTQVDAMPDESTRTYNAKITLEENPFNIGAIIKLQIVLGEEEGLWIPVSSIMADGEDYVYVIEDGRAMRKNVTIEGSRSSKARVKGLSPGDALVVEGYGNLKQDDHVEIEN